MIVRHRPLAYRHPLFPSGLGDLPPTVMDTQAAQAAAPVVDKVGDLSMFLSILSSAFLILRD